MKPRTALCLAVATLALYLLTGCGLNRKQAETGAVSGSLNGQPLSVQWTRDTDGTTTIQLPPAVTTAAGFLPSPWGELAQGALALIAGGGVIAARAQSRRAAEHKADADEGWSRALKANPPIQGDSK